jgi:hypothetical protein
MAEMEAKLKAYEDEKSSRARAEQEAQEKQKVQMFQDAFGQKLAEAAVKTGLPRSPLVVNRLAAIMDRQFALLEANEIGDADFLPPETLAAMVRDDYQAEHQALTDAMDDDALEGWLGAKVLKRINQINLRKLKAGQRQVGVIQQPAAKPVATNGTKAKRQFYTEEEAEKILAERLKQAGHTPSYGDIG